MTTHSIYLREERLAIQATARKFAMEEVLPVANELDPLKKEVPWEMLARMGELGYFGIYVPKEHGGMGLGVFEYCMITEELARAWMSVGCLIARGHYLGVDVADEERRVELIRQNAKGVRMGAVALSEPNVGSDLASIECRAVHDGDEWVITGEKKWCGNALRADFIHLFAQTGYPEGKHPATYLSVNSYNKTTTKFFICDWGHLR